MEKIDFLKNLEFLYTDKVGLSMYMIIDNNGIVEKRKADIDEEVINDLKKQFLEQIKDKFINNNDLIYSELTTSTERRNTLFHYDINEKPKGLDILDELYKSENAPEFNFEKDDYNEVTAFVFLIGTADEKIVIYKKLYPISLIKRDSILMVKKAKTRLVKVHEDILKINASFEFIKVKDDLFVTNINALEKFFGFEQIIRNQATANLELIEESKLLQDIKPLKELSADLKFAKKLMRVKKNSPVWNLPFDKVRGFIQNHPLLSKKIRFSENNESISLDTKVSKELFVKLLDDDFLKSDLTNYLYESENKEQITE